MGTEQGVPEVVIRDGKVAWIRIKPSDAILRLLAQGANPRKYGRTGAPPPEPARPPRVASNAEVREALASRLRAFRQRVRRERGMSRVPGDEAATPHPNQHQAERAPAA